MRLTSVTLLVVLVAGAVALLAAAVFVRGWRRGVLAAVAALLLVGFGLADVNRHFAYYRSWRDLLGVHSPDLVATPIRGSGGLGAGGSSTEAGGGGDKLPRPPRGHGELIPMSFPGERSGITRSGFVYLPPQYFDRAFATVKFPVVELLHGSPGVPGDWVLGLNPEQVLAAEIAAERAGPMVLVMPDTNGTRLRSTECVDAVRGEKNDTYLSQDVVADVRDRFRVAPTGWGIEGYSTGAFCAANLALRHPDQYAAVASIDGYFHAIDDRYARGLWKGDNQARLDNSPDYEIAHMARPAIAWYLMAGRQDESVLRESQQFAALAGFTATDRLVVQPDGRHNFADWKAATPPAFDWLWHRIASADLQRRVPTIRTTVTG